MSDDNFDDIIQNMGDAEDDDPTFEKVMDFVAHYWKQFHPGDIFVKGLIVAEVVTPAGFKTLRLRETSDMQEWDLLGMLGVVLQRLQSQDVIETYEGGSAGGPPHVCDDGCDEDGEEDE